MVLGKKWLFWIGNGAEIRHLEKGGKFHVPRCDKGLFLMGWSNIDLTSS